MNFDIMGDNSNKTTIVADCLQYLDMVGWSETIDTRWRRQVEKDLRIEFGDTLSQETLSNVVSIVLSPYKELAEEEYEFLDNDDGYYMDFIEKRKMETGWNQRKRSDQKSQS